MSSKIPLTVVRPKKTKPLKYRGKEVIPLTQEAAGSLRVGDKIKYIGPLKTKTNLDGPSPYSYSRRTLYSVVKRQVFSLAEIPLVTNRGLTIQMWAGKYTVPFSHVAVVARGDIEGTMYRRARNLVIRNLHSYKRTIGGLEAKYRRIIDKHLDRLPLHKKLELFKNLPPEEKKIYEALNRDVLEALELNGETKASDSESAMLPD